LDAAGDQIGWEARVEARTRDGALVGAAESECLRAESKWADRDDYALRSMAQTRATSKALRQPLGFVVALAGYAVTPAEEMPDDLERPTFEAPDPAMISSAQRGRIFAIASSKNVSEAEIRQIVLAVTGQESTKSIPKTQYDEIVEAIEAAAVPSS